MGHDWILGVLSDLKTYAEQNGLPSLAGQLTDTAVVARAEIAGPSDRDHGTVKGNNGQSRRIAGEVGVG